MENANKTFSTEKINEAIRKHIIDVVLVVGCLIYVLRALVDITNTGKTIWEILGDGAIAFIYGFCVSRALDLKGLASGESSALFIATLNAYATIIALVTPIVEKLPEWCNNRNQKEIRREQTKLLFTAGIAYETFIKPDFDISKYSKEKQEVIKRAYNLKIKELSSDELTSEPPSHRKNTNGFYLGKTKGEYVKSSTQGDAIKKVFFGIVFGYFTVKLITGFSWALIIWYLIQTAIFLFMGAIKFTLAYFFITGEFRNRFIKKTTFLYEFYNENKEAINGHIQEEPATNV